MTAHETPAVTPEPKLVLKDSTWLPIIALVILGALLLLLGFPGAFAAKRLLDVGDVVFNSALVLAGFGALFTSMLMFVLAPRGTTR